MPSLPWQTFRGPTEVKSVVVQPVTGRGGKWNSLDHSLPGPRFDGVVMTQGLTAGEKEDEAYLVLCLCSTEASCKVSENERQ